MKKAVISVLVGTAVLAFVACGKNAATENSSDSGVSTVSASSQVENGQKATRVNQGTNLSPDRKSTRLNSSHIEESRMPSSA